MICERINRANQWRNAKLPSITVGNLDVAIESPKGTLRHGKKWIQMMAHDYGFIKNTIAIDGDEVDAFVGPSTQSRKMYIIEQVDPKTQEFDEYKVMLGFNNIAEAKDAYHANYPEDWTGFKHIEETTTDKFDDWYRTSKK